MLCYVPLTSKPSTQGGVMVKKLCVLFLAGCLVTVSAPATVPAAQQRAVLKDMLLCLQGDLQAADPAGELDPLTIETMILLDRLHEAVTADDTENLQRFVQDYAAAIAPLQDQQLNLTCLLPLLMSVFSSTTTMLNTVAAGGDQTCQFLRLTNSAADIVSAVQTYKICMIDSSETPDQTTREQIVRRQVVVKTYNFITSALYTGYCKVAPTFFDWFNVLLDFFAIFPKEYPEETP